MGTEFDSVGIVLIDLESVWKELLRTLGPSLRAKREFISCFIGSTPGLLASMLRLILIWEFLSVLSI